MPEQNNDSITVQDLRNGLGDLLQYVGKAIEIAKEESTQAAQNYLNEVSEDIITGKGHIAPNTGPVTPPK